MTRDAATDLASGLDHYAKRNPWLRAMMFAIESFIVHLFWWAFGAVVARSSGATGGWALERVGPGRKGRMVEDNLRIAFPELDARRSRRWHDARGTAWGWCLVNTICRKSRDQRRSAYRNRDHCGIMFIAGANDRPYSSAHICAIGNYGARACARRVLLMALYAPLQNPRLNELMAQRVCSAADARAW
jgi:lauroyl/myristoyl acyltransferase